jgi:hypothetical protein
MRNTTRNLKNRTRLQKIKKKMIQQEKALRKAQRRAKSSAPAA